LRHLASILRDHVREYDIACRHGGEEFALIMPGSSLETAAERTEAIREMVRQLHLLHRSRMLGTISISTGVAVFPEHGRSWPDLVAVADRALYTAKERGRDCVATGSDERQRPRRRRRRWATSGCSPDLNNY
jgi:diguanylate cyclase (GGDEF)-like protein